MMYAIVMQCMFVSKHQYLQSNLDQKYTYSLFVARGSTSLPADGALMESVKPWRVEVGMLESDSAPLRRPFLT